MLPFKESMVTPESTKGLWQLMAKEYSTTVISKDDSALMALVAGFLDTMGILDKETFLEGYTTTIGSRIYCPFVPGIATERFTLWSQVIICAHENLHALQARREGLVVFSAKYLSSDDIRAVEYEAPAYRTTMELEAWRLGGHVPDVYPRFLAEKLKNYNCGSDAIDAAEEALNIALDDIEAGNIITETSIKTIQFLTGTG